MGVAAAGGTGDVRLEDAAGGDAAVLEVVVGAVRRDGAGADSAMRVQDLPADAGFLGHPDGGAVRAVAVAAAVWDVRVGGVREDGRVRAVRFLGVGRFVPAEYAGAYDSGAAAVSSAFLARAAVASAAGPARRVCGCRGLRQERFRAMGREELAGRCLEGWADQ